MANVFKAPGIYREEIDQSDILVPDGVSNGGVVVRSQKGPINRPVRISNDKEYIETFGKPVYTSGTSGDRYTPEYGFGSYAALEFLKESSQLTVVRGWSTDDKYANCWVGDDLGIEAYTSAEMGNYTDISPESEYADFDELDNIQALEDVIDFEGAINVFSNNPSKDGNNIAITIEPFSPWADWRYTYDPYPADETAATSMSLDDMSATTYYPIASKVFKISIFVKPEKSDWRDFIDETGKVGDGLEDNQYTSGTAASVSGSSPTYKCYRLEPVEVFYGSLTSVFDDNNNDLWIENVVNGVSKYIYVKTDSSVTNFVNLDSYDYVSNKKDTTGRFIFENHLVKFANGASSQDTGIGNIAGWSGFQDREYSNVSILINCDHSANVKQEVARIAAKRMDCIAIGQVGTLTQTSRSDIKDSESYGYVNPSYMALYAGYSKVFDSYNNKYVFLPNAIFGASLMARTDRVANPWSAPAGINRGILPVFDQKKIFTEFDIGELYERNINCVKFLRGIGFAMFGQKTAQLKNSALERINVRRLLLYIENNIENTLNQFLFENNTDKTRLRVYNIVEEFLRQVYSGGGLEGYKVVCDDTNNPSQVIDSNQLNVDIYVQPTQVIEYIKLSTVIARSGVNISEILLA